MTDNSVMFHCLGGCSEAIYILAKSSPLYTGTGRALASRASRYRVII